MAYEVATLDSEHKPASEQEFWEEQLRLASKEEEQWRSDAEDLMERYRCEPGCQIPVFTANVQLLAPQVYSQPPAPDVRRRNRLEDPFTAQTGTAVAQALERALVYVVDDPAFDAAMEAVRDDSLIVGRGVSRVRYNVEIERRDVTLVPGDPAFGVPDLYLLDGVTPVEPEFDEDGAPYVDVKSEEAVAVESVHWADYRQCPARKFADVWWVAYRHVFDRAELEEEFGKEIARQVPMTMAASSGNKQTSPDPSDRMPPDPPSSYNRAVVWECWDKRSRERKWYAQGAPRILRTDPDPYGLSGFFPSPEPLMYLRTSDSLVPIPEFETYRELTDELDEVNRRISKLVRVARAVCLIDGDFAEGITIASSSDGALIPIERPGATAEDLAASVWWWPLGEVAGTLTVLTQRADRLQQLIWQISGISDIQRGTVAERESAAASKLKVSYGGLRQAPRSVAMSRHVRAALEIAAEIMAELFDPARLEEISGIPISPQVLEMLRTDKLRDTQIVVATDATVRPDALAEREQAVEYLGASTTFLQQVAAVSQVMPAMVPLMLETFKQASLTFKWARNVETQIDQTVATIEQQAMQAQAMQQQAAMMQQMGMPQ